LERLIDDLDRRIKRGQDRVELQDGPLPAPAAPSEKVKAITDKIQATLLQIETLAEEGKVTESQQLLQVVEQLKSEKDQLVKVPFLRSSRINNLG
jgi:hypothetical protein